MTALTPAYVMPPGASRQHLHLLRRIIGQIALAMLVLMILLVLTATAGCTALQNQVAAPRDNTKLSGNVAEQIFADGVAATGEVRVSSDAGIVTLTGQVGDDAQAVRIADCVANVQGVMHVENRLRVSQLTDSGQKERRTLIEDVRQALETSLPGHGSQLLVEADEGVVYLTGIVPDQQIKSAAIFVARSVEGVQAVADNLISEQ